MLPAKIMLQSNFICSVYQIAYRLQLQIKIGFLYEVFTCYHLGRHGGLMVDAPVSRLSYLGSSPGREHCVVFIG